MMFPALREGFKEFRQGLGTDIISLDLKSGVYDPNGSAWYAANGFSNLARMHGYGEPTWSGQSVNIDTARTNSVVWCCERIISESIAFMPLLMMQDTAKGKFPANGTDVPAHPMYASLKYAPNDEMSAMSFRETETAHCVMGGNLFAKIERRSGTNVAYELYPINPAQACIDRDKKKRLVYEVKDGNSPAVTYTVERGKPHDILHVPGLSNDGINGYSVISMARQSIGTAQSAEKYAAKFYANGGRPPYHIEWDKKFQTDNDFNRWSERWQAAYGSSENFHKAPITEPGMKIVADGLSPQDSQFLETRQFEIPEICRWFLISPHMVGDLSRATFSNIEHLALQFVKMTLSAWITRWEQGLWRCVLTPEEKTQGYYFKHNVNGLLRGDFASRMAGYATALQNGHKNIDEVRDLEDDNPLPNGAGKAYHIQLNMATVPGTGQPMVAEQGILDRMSQSKKPAA